MSSLADRDKIKIVQEYFVRADQGRPDVLELFHENAEIYFPKFGLGFGRQSLFEMVKGFVGALEFIKHDYDGFTFMPSGDYLVVEGTSRGAISGKSGREGRPPADASATCSSFEMIELQASTSISIPITPERMRGVSGGARSVTGKGVAASCQGDRPHDHRVRRRHGRASGTWEM